MGVSNIVTLEYIHLRLEEAHKAASEAVVKAQVKMKKWDGKRRDVQFQVGDRVLLSAANLKLPSMPGSESYKLNEKYIGPFKEAGEAVRRPRGLKYC
jgi:hypothetical protein